MFERVENQQHMTIDHLECVPTFSRSHSFSCSVQFLHVRLWGHSRYFLWFLITVIFFRNKKVAPRRETKLRSRVSRASSK